jgi:hypothetical protein
MPPGQPTASDDCGFDQLSPNLCTITRDAGVCRSLTTPAAWAGSIRLSYGALGLGAGASNMAGGKITTATNTLGNSNVVQLTAGGTMDYSASAMNDDAQHANLALYVCNGGDWTFSGTSFSRLGAELDIGYDYVTGASSPGVLNENAFSSAAS